VTLTAALRAASERGPRDTILPRRALAQHFLAGGDREAAVREYRSILEIEPNSDDRVSLAEIFARDMKDLGQAVAELNHVLATDLRHAPTYRLLVSLYERAGERDRVARVLTVLDMLGYAEDTERQYLASLRARLALRTRARSLSDDLREQFLLPPGMLGPFLDVYLLVREPLLQFYPLTYVGENPQPLVPGENPAFAAAIGESLRVFGLDADFVLATRVPGATISVDAAPKPVVVLDRDFVSLGDAEIRFLLGRCIEPLRGGYGLLMRLAPSQRKEVGNLLLQLLLPDSQRDPAAQEFARSLPRKVLKSLEKIPLSGSVMPDPAMWFQALGSACDRAGLLVADDVGAAMRILARFSGQELLLGTDGEVALGAVGDGADLVRYFLSDDFHRLNLAMAATT
jgi:tetratricopeptide (TPR) repeat protein